MENNVVQLDDYKNIEDVMKVRLGADQVVFAAVLPNGILKTYIPHEIADIDLVYIIQTLADRRQERLHET